MDGAHNLHIGDADSDPLRVAPTRFLQRPSAMLVIAGAAPTSLLARVTIPAAHWLAMISYSLYLIHKAMFKLAEKYMPLPFAEHPLAIFVAYASLTLLGGAALHYLVEAPFLAIRDRRRPSVLPIAHAAVVTRSE